MCPRPPELDEALREQKEDNDLKITNALSLLEDKKEGRKYKPTQEVLAKLAECSLGAVRTRDWAVNRLKRIKEERKKPDNGSRTSNKMDVSVTDAQSTNEFLRNRINKLLEQNAVLYEENICLNEDIVRLEKINKRLIGDVKKSNVHTRNSKGSKSNVVSLNKRMDKGEK